MKTFQTIQTSRPAALSLLALSALALLSACGGSGGSTTPVVTYPAVMPVSINFELLANGVPVKCGSSITGLGSKASTAELKDARFYISNVKLIDANDKLVPVTLTANDWQNDQVSLISFNDGSTTACGGTALPTNSVISGTVPGAAYKGISYEIGVPETLNHTDYATATKPMNVAAMAWSWTSGRKFMKLELNPVGGVNVTRVNNTTVPPTTTNSVSSTWNLHLGSVGCTTNASNGSYSCTNSNRMVVKLANFDADKQKISLDMNALFTATDLKSDTTGAVGCMSGTTDQECKGIFDSFKIDLSSGNPTTAGVQSVFVARNK